MPKQSAQLSLSANIYETKKIGAPSTGPLKLASGELTTDCAKLAETFASSFSSVYTTLELNEQFPHQVSNNSINNVEFTLEDGKNKLSALDKNSNMGPNGLHPYLLNSCPNLAIPLHMIFQQSVAEGRLPTD